MKFEDENYTMGVDFAKGKDRTVKQDVKAAVKKIAEATCSGYSEILATLDPIIVEAVNKCSHLMMKREELPDEVLIFHCRCGYRKETTVNAEREYQKSLVDDEPEFSKNEIREFLEGIFQDAKYNRDFNWKQELEEKFEL